MYDLACAASCVVVAYERGEPDRIADAMAGAAKALVAAAHELGLGDWIVA